MGGPPGCGNRAPGPAGFEPRADAYAIPGRGRAAAAGALPQADPGRRGSRAAADAHSVRCGPAPRVRGAGAETQTMNLSLLAVLAVGQGAWGASPPHPTVGDTIWLSREVATPAGWRLRPGKLESTDQVEPLGEPAVLRAPGGWVIRYPVVAWSPGPHQVALPPVWRLALDGHTDSVPGGVASFAVRGVIPDSSGAPEPKAALGPLRSDRRRPLVSLGALLAALALGAAGVAWRRRPPRPATPGVHVPLEPEVPDARWLAAGEPKAVAARAAGRLRHALAHAIPAAHAALSTAECLAAVERARPDAPLRELRELLHALDQVAFATAHGVDVVPLAARARALARDVEGNGAKGKAR